MQIRCWDDQCVVHALRSGDTHLVNGLAAQVLLAATEGSWDLERMAVSIARQVGVKADQAFLAHLHAVVGELQTKGLLSRTCFSPN
ncbi:MAG: hypothetical protein FD187_2334 [bacterium]|nr:MAG: hypothetical protein FD142_2446 [bacterium]KAF0148013.1 MAG: hypothetical protein FD187_2334 [bacterium]KAF0164889.1 MAG: hypothetical protein FD158_2990 [bacterium]TXT16904.1 MAG: hypothetical protein FD132_2656 [bacterium]